MSRMIHAHCTILSKAITLLKCSHVARPCSAWGKWVWDLTIE